MIIRAYGLFWRVDEINWFPGAGNGGEFRLLGRIGKNHPTVRIADFRDQRGIYILYGDLGPHYAGLVRGQALGSRLKQHMKDHHEGQWDRFSWFGFRAVLEDKLDDGTRRLKDLVSYKSLDQNKIIKDLEAIVVKSMALNNAVDSHFSNAKRWTQIKSEERQKFLDE